MPINATTLTRVKALMGDPGNDNLLTSLIEGVTREIEAWIGYELELKERTEFYAPTMNNRSVYLNVVPVVSVAEVKVAERWDYVGAGALVPESDFHLVGGLIGELYFTEGVLIYDTPHSLRVKYTAGFSATDLVEGTIALAADHQVAEEFRRRDNPNTLSRPGPKGSKTYAAPHKFLPRVEELLQAHRRYITV